MRAMTTLAIVSIIVTAAALFGWLSVRVFRLPITIGTMLLTVISSVIMIVVGRVFPGLHVGPLAWQVVFGLRILFCTGCWVYCFSRVHFSWISSIFHARKASRRAPFGHRHAALNCCSGVCYALDSAALWDGRSVD